MREDPKPLFLWKGMKENIINYVVRCLECQQVNFEHRPPAGLLQPHSIQESKWEVISMDFIVGLPLTERRNDLIFLGSRHSDEECSFYSSAYNASRT
jgi:hypothetical protein